MDVKFSSTKRKAIRRALARNPKWAEEFRISAKGLGLGMATPIMTRNDEALHPDVVDALTEQDMTHVSRPRHLDSLHDKGVTGKGITVAVIDSGIAPHEDIKDQIVAFRDFTGRRTVKRNPMDPAGHGTHVAGIIAGSGEEVQGVAPDAKLVGCRVNSQDDAIKAIDWVIKNREKFSIDVLNLSLGVDAPTNPEEDEFRKAAERAVDAGLIVVTAAGNECNGNTCKNSISSPGISPKVITVGALDDMGTKSRSDDRVYGSSSRGRKKGEKPDLVAEGVNVLGPLASKSSYADNMRVSAEYVALAGSSQAVPMVAGTIALMLQVNPTLGHETVKEILRSTADELKKTPKYIQGQGRLDVKGAVAAAKRRLG
jgi:serine protease AprX